MYICRNYYNIVCINSVALWKGEGLYKGAGHAQVGVVHVSRLAIDGGESLKLVCMHHPSQFQTEKGLL